MSKLNSFNLLLLFLIVTVLIGYLSMIISSIENFQVLLMSFLHFLLSSFIIYDNYRKVRIIEILNPIIFYALLWFVAFGIIPLLVVFSEDILPGTPLTSYKYISFIPIAQILSMVSLISLYFGFKTKLFKSPISNNKEYIIWKTPNVLLAAFIYFIVSIITVYYLIESKRFFYGVRMHETEYSESFIYYIMVFFGAGGRSPLYFCGPLLILIIAYAYSKKRLFLNLFIAVFLFNIFTGIIAGQKEKIFASLLIIFFYLYYLRKKKLTIKNESLIALILFLFMLSFPIIYRYRVIMDELDIDVKFPKGVVTFFSDIAKNVDYLEIYREIGIANILGRIDHLHATLPVIANPPGVMGNTYLKVYTLPLMFLPGIGSSGDEGVINNAFARVYGIISPFDYQTAITLPQMTEVYMNFGYFLVPVFMFLYGVLYRIIYELMKSFSPNRKLIGFVIWYIWVIQFSGYCFYGTLGMQLRVLAGLFILYIILNFKSVTRFVLR